MRLAIIAALLVSCGGQADQPPRDFSVWGQCDAEFFDFCQGPSSQRAPLRLTKDGTLQCCCLIGWDE